jgi:hypothetical protein
LRYATEPIKGKGLALAIVSMLVFAAPAAAQTGGSTTPPPESGTTTTPPATATLNADGSVTPPANAPRPVRKAINAANKIRYKPYLYGGGHRSWKAKGYDCSGAVSFVLHAAGLLKKRPMDSGTFAKRWGAPGIGQWITVYANRGHAYAVIAGIRWDTSAVGEPINNGSGPRWRSSPRDAGGYTSKYFPGL